MSDSMRSGRIPFSFGGEVAVGGGYGDERPVSGFGHRRLPALPDGLGRRLQEGNPAGSLELRLLC